MRMIWMLGLDEQGCEILSYLPGKTVGTDYSFDHPCVHSDGAICDMARFMRKLHDVSAGFLPTAIENGWENPYFSDRDYETICHGDAAIWNFVLVDDEIAGIFDFDQAYPGTRVWDLTTILFSAVLPSCYDYEHSKHVADTRRRIKLFFDAYGMDCPADTIALTADRIQRHFIDDMRKKAEAGDEACIRSVEGGSINHYQNVVAYLKAHIYDWM